MPGDIPRLLEADPYGRTNWLPGPYPRLSVLFLRRLRIFAESSGFQPEDHFEEMASRLPGDIPRRLEKVPEGTFEPFIA